MKYIFNYLLFSLIFLSCAKPDPEAQKPYLEGYWEIKEVEMPNLSKKDFDINLVVDFIELNKDNGQRIKVVPQLDGSFTTNGVTEDFELKIENDSLRMYYKTPFDEWMETVVKAEDSLLIIKNRDNKIYTYHKYVNTPIIKK